MKQISVLVKPASSLCNMRCAYCFYADVSSRRTMPSYGIMQQKTAEALIQNIMADLSAGDKLEFAFQGGEPTLAGLDFFRSFVAMARQQGKGLQLTFSLQTNGLLLNDAWCAFLAEHKFLVGLSLDLAMHDENRLDAEGKGTQKRVLEAKANLERCGVEYNILTVLTNAAARHPAKIWAVLQKYGIQYVQFIPCLGVLDNQSSGKEPHALTPKRFAGFYNGLIPLWYKAFIAGQYTSVKLIDDLVHLLRNGRANACGLLGTCSPQLVVEADGSVYPCDFYVLDETRLGSLATQGLRELYESEAMAAFPAYGKQEHASCKACPFLRMCGGGCKRMKSVFHGAEGYCGYRDILQTNLPLLQRVAQMV